MDSVKLTSQERNDIVNALREKAQGDREAAHPLLNDEHEGRRHMAQTLVAQAERQERLADRLEA